MTIQHAQPATVIDVRPLGTALAETKTGTLFKTENVEVIRMVMPTGKEISEHRAPGEIIVQCLEGEIAFTAREKTETLTAGQLLYLTPKEPHSVKCIEAASFLLTMILRPGKE